MTAAGAYHDTAPLTNKSPYSRAARASAFELLKRFLIVTRSYCLSAAGLGRLRSARPKLLSELLSNRLPMAATTTKEARNELENWWARLGSNQRPADYESAALTS